jgi:hypothetical protein
MAFAAKRAEELGDEGHSYVGPIDPSPDAPIDPCPDSNVQSEGIRPDQEGGPTDLGDGSIGPGGTGPIDLHNQIPSNRDPFNSRSRARGLFEGRRLKVSHRQHQLFMDELGRYAEHIDLRSMYPIWDAELVATDELFDTLRYLRRRVTEAVRAFRATVPPSARNREPVTVWTELVERVRSSFDSHLEQQYFEGAEVLQDSPDHVVIASAYAPHLKGEYRSRLEAALKDLRPGATLEIIELPVHEHETVPA